MEPAEGHLLETAVYWLKTFIEVVGAVLVGTGSARAAVEIARGALAGKPIEYTRIRLKFARQLSLALEFLLAADIVATAFDPTWEQVGILAAIAAIRTALNFFLQREIEEERRELASEAGDLVRPVEEAR
jgi:uncharacterized membrane protein